MKINPVFFLFISLTAGFLFIPVRICQAFCLCFILIIIFSFICSKSLEKNIKIERSTEELKLSCGEKVEISFVIKNYSRFTAFVFYFMDQAAYFQIYGKDNQGLITLHSREQKKITYTVSAKERGLFEIGPVIIQTQDPLGLFTVKLELPPVLKITVRPARTKLITETQPGFPMGNLKIQNICYEDVTMRRSIREYQNGDEQKRINWRASAKFGGLFTNQFEDSYDAPFFIFLNLAEDDYNLHERQYHSEKAIEIAAALVEKSRYLRQQCGFAAYGTGFPYIRPAQNQADGILDVLSLIHLVPGKLDYDPVQRYKNQLPAGTLLFVVGPDEVEKYYLMVQANEEDLNTKKIGIMKNE